MGASRGRQSSPCPRDTCAAVNAGSRLPTLSCDSAREGTTSLRHANSSAEFWPLLLLLAAIAAAWAAGLPQQISWAALARNQAALADWVASHPIAAPALYVVIYAVAAALSLPEARGADRGGRLAVRHPVRRRARRAWDRRWARSCCSSPCATIWPTRWPRAPAASSTGVRARLERDGFSYLLAIRLVPAFPFWLVNLAAGAERHAAAALRWRPR